MAINETFKDCIKRIKFEQSLNQEAIAEKLGVHKSYLSDMINGRVPLTDKISDKIYELFKIKVQVEEHTVLSIPDTVDLSEDPKQTYNDPCPECQKWKDKYLEACEKLNALNEKYNEVNEKYNELLEHKLLLKKEEEASDSAQGGRIAN